MKKRLSLIILSIALALVLLPWTKVNAKEIKTLEVENKNGKISISGTVEDGMLAVQTIVYDVEGKEIIVMQSTDVANDNTFSDEIEVTEGDYLVKVADYDGGAYKTVTVKKGEETTTEEETTPTTSTPVATTATPVATIEQDKKSNPKTGDEIAVFVTLIVISSLGIAILKKSKK